jgi:hypothetical protein
MNLSGLNGEGNYFLNIHINGLPYGEVIYPILYKLPDDNEDYTIDEYIPYGEEHLVPTVVTEIVSKGVSGDVLDTVAIPEVVKSLDGYGEGLNNTYFNYIDYERKVYVQNVGKYIFTGNEKMNAWTKTDGSYIGITIDNVIPYDTSAGSDIRGICNDFNVKASNSSSVRNIGFRQIGDGLARLYFCDPNITSKEMWQEYFSTKNASSNPVTLVYKLAEPIVTQIDDAVAPKFIKVEGGGEIVFENEAKADVPSSIKYVRKV